MNRVLGEVLDYESEGWYSLEGKPFTGVAYTLSPDGKVESDQEFRDGLQWGTVWERFRSGNLHHDATFYQGVYHGRAREWHENGQLAEDGEYEYGVAIWQKKWDEHGMVVEDYRLTETDGNFDLLQTLRRVNGVSTN